MTLISRSKAGADSAWAWVARRPATALARITLWRAAAKIMMVRLALSVSRNRSVYSASPTRGVHFRRTPFAGGKALFSILPHEPAPGKAKPDLREGRCPALSLDQGFLKGSTGPQKLALRVATR